MLHLAVSRQFAGVFAKGSVLRSLNGLDTTNRGTVSHSFWGISVAQAPSHPLVLDSFEVTDEGGKNKIMQIRYWLPHYFDGFLSRLATNP